MDTNASSRWRWHCSELRSVTLILTLGRQPNAQFKVCTAIKASAEYSYPHLLTHPPSLCFTELNITHTHTHAGFDWSVLSCRQQERGDELTARHGDVFHLFFISRSKSHHSQFFCVIFPPFLTWRSDKRGSNDLVSPLLFFFFLFTSSKECKNTVSVFMPMTAQKLRRVIFVSRRDLSDTSCPPCLHNHSLFRASGKIKRSERRETTTSLLFLGHQKYRNESVFILREGCNRPP